MRLVRVPFSPGDVFAEQRERPTFWLPWVVVSVIFAVIQILQSPFQRRVQELMMAQAGRPVPTGGPGPLSYVITTATGFVTVLVMCAISAAILYMLMSVLGGETTYKKMLTVAIFTWPIALLQQLITVAVLMQRGVAAIRGPWDMFVSFGADVLLPADAQLGAFMRIFLAGIGPLQIWGVVITAVGLMVLAKAGKGSAWTGAIVSYLVGLSIGAGLGSFGMKMMGG
jgi:hypothetical protein